MKKMKRFVAILLASVLALAMLTACGEEAPQSLGQRAENLMIESFNKAYDTTYQNDADLKNKVGAMLNQIDENGEIDIASLNKSKIYGLPCNGVQREHNKKLNNGLPILHKVPPKRDYGRYFCIMAEKGGTSHGGLTEKLSPFFHAKKQEVNAYGR